MNLQGCPWKLNFKTFWCSGKIGIEWYASFISIFAIQQFGVTKLSTDLMVSNLNCIYGMWSSNFFKFKIIQNEPSNFGVKKIVEIYSAFSCWNNFHAACFCFSKYHHRWEKLLCINNFHGQPIGLCNPLKRLLFLESSVQIFLIPTTNLLIIPGLLFSLDCLFSMMVSIISSWSWIFPSSETLSSTVVLFLPWCSNDQALIKKIRNLFEIFQKFITQGVILEDVEKSGLVKNEQSLDGLCCWRITRVWRFGELKILQIGDRHICLQFRHAIFLTSFFGGFLAMLMVQIKVQELFV